MILNAVTPASATQAVSPSRSTFGARDERRRTRGPNGVPTRISSLRLRAAPLSGVDRGSSRELGASVAALRLTLLGRFSTPTQ